MREFNLEEAKAGKPVCTRDGRNARIICFDCKNVYFPIIALIEDGDIEHVYRYGLDGNFFYKQKGCTDVDLFMRGEREL